MLFLFKLDKTVAEAKKIIDKVRRDNSVESITLVKFEKVVFVLVKRRRSIGQVEMQNILVNEHIQSMLQLDENFGINHSTVV